MIAARRRLRPVWTLLALFALSVLAAELVLRLRGFGKRIEYDASLAVLWQPRPNQRAFNNITNAPVTIDHRGLRSVPRSGEETEGRLKVLCLGDSVTFGYALADGETYVSQLQASLEESEPGRWHLMNAGVNGYNFYLVRKRLADLLERKIDPDLLLIGFCFNEYQGWPGEHFSDEEKRVVTRGVPRRNALRSAALFNYATEIVSARYLYRLRNALMPGRGGDNPKAQVPVGEWLQQYRRQVEALFGEAQQRRIPVMVIAWPDAAGVLGEYRAALIDECSKRKIPCLNLTPLLEGRDRSGMFFDFEHPRPETVKLYVREAIGPFFREHAPQLRKKPALVPGT